MFPSRAPVEAAIEKKSMALAATRSEATLQDLGVFFGSVFFSGYLFVVVLKGNQWDTTCFWSNL